MSREARPVGPPSADRREGRDGSSSGGEGPAAASTGSRERADGRPVADGWERRVLLEDGAEVDPEELRDFLAADLLEVEADPVFRERLRHKLWKLVRSRRSPHSAGDGG